MYHPNIHDVVKNNPDLARQLQSFKDYAAQVKAKRMADKMLIDNLFVQLVEAKAAALHVPVNNDIIEVKQMVATVKCEVSNIHRIFNKVADEKPAKKLTPKQKRELALKEALEAEKAEIVLKLNQR